MKNKRNKRVNRDRLYMCCHGNMLLVDTVNMDPLKQQTTSHELQERLQALTEENVSQIHFHM